MLLAPYPVTCRRIAHVVLVALAVTALTACDRKARPKEGDLAGEVALLMPRVEEAAGLTFKQPPKVEARTAEQVREFLQKQFSDSATANDLAMKTRVYKRLGMIPDTMDVVRMLTSLLEEQVAGFYDPKAKTLYVVSGRSGVDREITLKHEMTHALQDQYVNLDSVQQLRGEDDRTSAAQAVFEGHATLAMLGAGARTIAWDQARQGVRKARESSPQFAAAPTFIAEGLLFPYLAGAEFVRNALSDGTTTAQLLAALPTSSSQILHVERWRKNANPVDRVRFTVPTGVQVLYENSFGEFETRLMLAELLRDVPAGARAARGADGDRYALVKTASGDGLVWVTTWDTALEAEEFAALAGDAFAKRYGLPVAEGGSGQPRVVVAQGRRLTVRAAQVGQRTVTIVEDVPAAMKTTLIRTDAITVTAR
jgi:hypothetical protein